jgi:hypothetical protein
MLRVDFDLVAVLCALLNAPSSSSSSSQSTSLLLGALGRYFLPEELLPEHSPSAHHLHAASRLVHRCYPTIHTPKVGAELLPERSPSAHHLHATSRLVHSCYSSIHTPKVGAELLPEHAQSRGRYTVDSRPCTVLRLSAQLVADDAQS